MYKTTSRPAFPPATVRACVGAALFALGAAGCGDSDGASSSETDEVPGVVYADGVAHVCGDGVLEAFEQCDAGDANSDIVADACRLDCRPARCGDGVIDAAEACDDGNTLGSDGCSPSCATEDGRFEVEPNDGPGDANAMEFGVPVEGFVSDGDVDCFVMEVPTDGSWLRASLSGDEGTCAGAMTLSVYSGAHELMATASSTVEAPCPQIGPADSGALRLLDAGTYRVCAEALLRRGERAYALVAESGDGCAGGDWELPVESDVDGDGIDARCDDDDDGDGYVDELDNCPSVANGGERPAFGLDDDGWLRHWIGVGFDEQTEDECLPLAETRFDPALAAPAAGDALGELRWRYVHQGSSQLRLDDAFGGGSQRASWMFAYVESPIARSAELRLGSDDGVRVWVNGAEHLAVADCRGAQNDQDIVVVDLVAGVNALAFKVYNGGGGWQLRARITDAEGEGLPDVVNLRDPDPTRVDDQSDRDGDGIGDACDSE